MRPVDHHYLTERLWPLARRYTSLGQLFVTNIAETDLIMHPLMTDATSTYADPPGFLTQGGRHWVYQGGLEKKISLRTARFHIIIIKPQIHNSS